MTALLAFGSILLLAVLLSELAGRSVLSLAVLFLGAGFLVGPGGLGWASFPLEGGVTRTVAEVALFAVLFTDGMRLSIRELGQAWRLPGRALLLGMPLTLGAMGVAAKVIFGMPWVESFLLAAVLSPTDPVLSAAIIGRREVPYRVRHLLNVESGINDGLALPAVMLLLSASGGAPTTPGQTLGELGLGVLVGVAVPLLVLGLRRVVPFFRATDQYAPLGGVALALILFALAEVIHANLFLAAFVAGITISSSSDRVRETFEEFGNNLAELLKLGGLFVFGATLTAGLLARAGWAAWFFAGSVLLLARPTALLVALFRTRLTHRERLTVGWFGPKGFASIFYGLVVAASGIQDGSRLFRIVAVVVVLSILAHTTSDVVISRRIGRRHATRDLPTEDPLAARHRQDAT